MADHDLIEQYWMYGERVEAILLRRNTVDKVADWLRRDGLIVADVKRGWLRTSISFIGAEGAVTLRRDQWVVRRGFAQFRAASRIEFMHESMPVADY